MKTPVRRFKDEQGVTSFWFVVVDADEKYIASFDDESDAAELVKIINAHEKLVEALEKITKYAGDEKLQYPYRVGAMKEVAAFALESTK